MFGASKSGSAALPSDSNFEYVTLLLDGNGTNGGQNNTFLDSSTNNFTITRNGNTTQGSFSPYGTLWSVYSDGSGDYLSISDSASFPSGTTEFCYELWFYPTATTNGVLLAKGGDGGYYEQIGIQYNSSDLKCYIANSSNAYIVNAGNFGTPTVGQWNHIAVYRSGNNFYGSLNGTVTSLATSSNSVVDNAAAFVVSGYSSPNPVASPVTGYISNLRLVTGSAVYGASNFTPPTTPLTAISGTQLLMCQANRFIDSSSNAFSITVGGNPSVQRFSPFEPSAPYSTSVIGGSGYFDGSGDNLSIANNSALNFDTGTFTVEAWFYQTTLAFAGVVSKWPNTGGDNWLVATNGDGAVRFYYNGGNILGGSYPINTWNHVAVSRDSSNVIRLFLNGTQVASVTSSFNSTGTAPVEIGSYASNQNNFTGYISDARVVKGTAVYTSAFTPPTVPLTAITNTSLLTSMTNASIFDYAMMNNLETAGNAQISTSVKKFGTGSISFDGTGDSLDIVQTTPFLSAWTGDFTIECWAYTNNLSAQHVVWANKGTNSSGYNTAYINTNGSIGMGKAGVNEIVSASSTWTSGQWNHLAFVRNGSNLTIYYNGTSVATTTSASTYLTTTATGFSIGKNFQTSTAYFNGYIDDFRVTYGLARYTANFTAPTAPFPIY